MKNTHFSKQVQTKPKAEAEGILNIHTRFAPTTADSPWICSGITVDMLWIENAAGDKYWRNWTNEISLNRAVTQYTDLAALDDEV